MRDYGKVHSSFWSSLTIREMSEDARALAIYLLTCPHGTIAGVFRLPNGYVCDDIQWGSERVDKGFSELLSNGFANRCETSKWVWVMNHLDWNKPENPNQKKSAQKIALSIPDQCTWKQEYIRVSSEILGIKLEPLANPSETLSEPVAVAVTVTETVTETVAVKEQKQSQKKQSEELPTQNLVAQELWDTFLKIRQKAKAVNSPQAIKCLITELQNLRTQGHDPTEVVNQSIRSSWKDVYPVKNKAQSISKNHQNRTDHSGQSTVSAA